MNKEPILYLEKWVKQNEMLGGRLNHASLALSKCLMVEWRIYFFKSGGSGF